MIARLRSLTSPQVRHELLLVAVLLAESCVAASWFLLLNRPGAVHSPGAALLGIAGLLAWAYAATRLLLASSLSVAKQRAAILGLLLLTALLVTRLHAYGRYPLGNTAWLAAWVSDWRGIFFTLRSGPIALAVVLFCWWRGVLLAYRDTTLASVAFGFRLNVLLMAAVGFIWPAGEASLGLVFLLFLFAVLAMALARVDELTGRLGGPDQPFNLSWGAIVAGSGGLVVGLGWLLARGYSPAGFARLIEWLWPALQVVGSALRVVGRLLLRVLLPFLEALFALLTRLLKALGIGSVEVPISEFPDATPTPMPAAAQPAGAGFPWLELLRWSAILLLVALAVAVVVFSLRKLSARRRPPLGDEQRSVLPPGDWVEDLLDNLRAGAARLADALGLVERFGLGKRLYAAVSIRFIYANVVRLAAERGFPRPPAITPYEFLPTLRLAFAGAEEDVGRITEAYVGVHYGESPASFRELQEIRRCWERVRGTSPASESATVAQHLEGEIDREIP